MDETIFRPHDASDSDRSDRAAGDRLRHRRKVRESIRENIADIISEESIIGKNRDRIIKVPLRGVKEYRFVYGDNAPGVAQGDGETKPGQVVGRKGQQGAGAGPGAGGNEPGQDYFETDITLDELIDIMFEDLELPELERKGFREIEAERMTRRKGYQATGIRVRLDKRRTTRARIRRLHAARKRRPEPESVEDGGSEKENAERFPFHKRDLTYRRMEVETRPESNAAVICIMDTSGSMDTMKKYLARSFFFLLYQFVCTKYRNVDVVFVAHHSAAREVTEEEFFHKGESGGTLISSGYLKALEIIEERYHPSMWNVYAFHCSDGDNFGHDNDRAIAAAEQLCRCCNLFGYGEIKPAGDLHFRNSSMMSVFARLEAENFETALIEHRKDIWPAFRSLLSRERTPTEA